MVGRRLVVVSYALSSLVLACGSSDSQSPSRDDGCDACLSTLELAFVRRVAFTHLIAQLSVDSRQAAPGVEFSAAFPLLYFPDSHGTLSELYAPVPVGDAIEPPCSERVLGIARAGDSFPVHEGTRSCRKFAYPEEGHTAYELTVTMENEPFSYSIDDLDEPEGSISDDDWLGSAAYTEMSYFGDAFAGEETISTRSELVSRFVFSNEDASLAADVSSVVELEVAAGFDVVSGTHDFRMEKLLSNRPVVLSLEFDRSGESTGTLAVEDETIADVTANLALSTLAELLEAFVVTPREGYVPAANRP